MQGRTSVRPCTCSRVWPFREIMKIIIGCCFLLLFGCQGNPNPQNRITSKSIEEVLEENRPHLMTIQGVVGTSIGECGGNPCIKVLVEKKTPVLQQQIPSMLETWQVEIVEQPAPK